MKATTSVHVTFRLFFLLSDALSAVVFYLFTCVCAGLELHSTPSRGVSRHTTLFAIACALTSFASLSLHVSALVGGVRSQFYLRLLQLVHCVREVPAAIVALYLAVEQSTHACCQQTAGYLLAIAVYLSVSAFVTSALVDKLLLAARVSVLGLLFSFQSRYFHFAARTLTLTLAASAHTDDYRRDPRLSWRATLATIGAYLLATGVYNVTVYWHTSAAASSKSPIVRTLFAVLKMLVDGSTCDNERIASPLARSAHRGLFLAANTALHLVCFRVWYLDAIGVLNAAPYATAAAASSAGSGSLFALLVRFNNRLALSCLLELEERIKWRQLALIFIVGSLVIAALAHHCHVAFYSDGSHRQEYAGVKMDAAASSSACSTKMSSLTVELESQQRVDAAFDGFSIDSLKQSSSIYSSSVSSSSRTLSDFSSSSSSDNSSCMQLERLDVPSTTSSSSSSNVALLYRFDRPTNVFTIGDNTDDANSSTISSGVMSLLDANRIGNTNGNSESNSGSSSSSSSAESSLVIWQHYYHHQLRESVPISSVSQLYY